jgi:hypothetical protein
LKNNDKLIFENWKQKLVTIIVAAVTEGGGVTVMAVKVPNSVPCCK